MTVSPPLVFIPIVIGILVALLGGFIVSIFSSRKKALAIEIARRERLLAGQTVLRTENERQWMRSQGRGQTPIVKTGTASTRLGKMEAIEACQGAVDSFTGGVLLLEPDDSSRQEYVNYFADKPHWAQKVIEVLFPLVPGGLLGRTPTEVLTLAPYYQRSVQQGTKEWLNDIRLNGNPVDLRVMVSPGGSGCLATTAIEEFAQEYDQAPVYCEFVLDEGQDRRKDNVPELLDIYASKAKGLLYLENRRHRDIVDQAKVRLQPAMVTARWVDGYAKAHHDVWADLYRHFQAATVRVFEGKIAVRYEKPFRDKLGPVYYSPSSAIEKLLVQGVLKVLRDPTLQSLPLEPAPDEPWFIYGIVPARPDDLSNISDAVRSDLASDLDWNTTLSFSTIGYPFTPTTSEVSVFVVALFPLQASLTEIKDYVIGKTTIDPKYG